MSLNFFTFNIMSTFLYIFSFIVSALICSFSYKAYKITKEKKFRNFLFAFGFITLSFVTQTITNIFVYINLKSGLDISYFVNKGFIIYAFLTIVGFFILAVMSLKIKDIKMISLLASIIFIFIIYSKAFIVAFRVVTLLLLTFITFTFYKNYYEKKTGNSMLVFFSFLLMTISQFFYIGGRFNEIIFIIGNAFLFIGYVLLFVTILRFK
ncbi:MAG: hypothetical protein QXG86_01070 [Candidatus Woesearchaeota archaeon]